MTTTLNTPLMEERIARKQAVNELALLRMELEEAATDLAAARQTILRMEQEADALRKERDEALSEVARYWTSADMKPWVDLAEAKGLGHFGKKLKGMFSRAMAAEEQARQSWEAQEAAEAKVTRLEQTLRNIAEGNLGDDPWQANYDRIRFVARAALETPHDPS